MGSNKVGNDVEKNLASYKSLQFVTEHNRSSMLYEIKRARAVWDPSLAIPGTERRGGFRCPVGTRYGGQITDRFGRQCGWGVSRRLANEISELGERLENVGDARRDRKLRKRNERMAGRLAGAPGAIERAAGRVGDVLDVTGREGGGRDRVGAEAPRPAGRLERAAGRLAEVVDPDKPPKGQARRTDVPNAPASPKVPRGRDGGRELTPAERARTKPDPQRGNDSTQAERARTKPDAPRGRRQVDAEPRPRPAAARRPRRNLRESEERRMQREIDNPGAPRTGPDAAPAPAARPRPAAPRRPANAGRRKPAAKPVRPKAPRAQENVKMPDFGGEGWDAITQPDGSTKYKKGNWTIEMLPAENGYFRGLKATSNDDGVPAITQNYRGPQGQGSLNSFLRNFENNALRGFGNEELAGGLETPAAKPQNNEIDVDRINAVNLAELEDFIAEQEHNLKVETDLNGSQTEMAKNLRASITKAKGDLKKAKKPSVKPKINLNSKWNQKNDGLWERNGFVIEPFFNADGKLEKMSIRAPGVSLEQRYDGNQGDADINDFAQSLYELAVAFDSDTPRGLETPAAKPRQRILGRLGARESGGKGYPPKKLAEFLGDMHDPVMAARYQRQQDEWSDQIVRDMGDWDKPDLPELEDIIRRREGQIELDRDRLDMEIRRFEKNPTREQALVVMARNYDLTIKDRVHRSMQQRARVLRGEERPEPAAREVTPTRGRTRVLVPRGRTRVPVPEGQSDNAANSERLRQARADRARGAGQEVDLNVLLNERFVGRYLRRDVFGDDRVAIVNLPANFPENPDRKTIKAAEAMRKIIRANAVIEKIDQAIARGELGDNDYIKSGNVNYNIPTIKTRLKDYADAWQEVYDANLDGESPFGKNQLRLLRADLVAAESNLDQMERNGERDAIIRKERARRDAIQNRIIAIQGSKPRDGAAVDPAAREEREDVNLLAAEPTEVLEEMREELENATDGRDSDDYKRVMAELKRRKANAPAISPPAPPRLSNTRLRALRQAAEQEAAQRFARMAQQLRRVEDDARLEETVLREILGDKWDQTSFDENQQWLEQQNKVGIPNAMRQWRPGREAEAELEESLEVTRQNQKYAKSRLIEHVRQFQQEPDADLAAQIMQVNISVEYYRALRRAQAIRLQQIRGSSPDMPSIEMPEPSAIPDPPGLANISRISTPSGTGSPRPLPALGLRIGESDDVIGRGVPEWQQFFEAQNEEDIPERVTRVMRAVQNGVSGADQQFNNEFNGGGDNMLRIRDREEMVRKYDRGLVALDRAVDAKRREYDAANPAQRDDYRIKQRDLIEAMAKRKQYGERRADIDAVLAQPAPEPLNPEMGRKAGERVKAAIVGRQKILADYLNERYGAGNAPWKEMTLERRRDLLAKAYDRSATEQERTEAKRALELWAEAMYSHDAILGNNGKTYRIKARATLSRNGEIEVYADIERKNADGGWDNAGSSARSIFLESGYIKNSSMFIRGQADKNNGIQTIYNQHAFKYAKAAGFDKVKVGTADDGPYVWGRIGFDSDTPIGNGSTSRMNEQLQAFRRGDPSIIKNAEDANIIEYLIQKHEEDPTSVRHMDFIYALSNPEKVNQTKKRKRDKELRDWFVTNMPLRQGVYYFEKNLVKDDPRD